MTLYVNPIILEGERRKTRRKKSLLLASVAFAALVLADLSLFGGEIAARGGALAPMLLGTAYTDPAMWTAGLTAMHTNANTIYICYAQPTTFTAASSTYNLGSATPGGGSTVGSPGADAGTGQQVTINAVSSG